MIRGTSLRTRRHRALCSWIAGAIAGSACLSSTPVSVPCDGPSDLSAVYVLFRDPNAAPIAWAVDGCGINEVLALDAESRLYALVYDRPLANLGFEAGPLEILGDDGNGRPIPIAPREFRFEADSAAHWAPLEDRAPIDALRVAALDPAACLTSGLCWQGAANMCSDCPAIEAPHPPEAPRPPIFTPCIDGWTPRPSTSPEPFEVCEPPTSPALLDCPSAQKQSFGAATCVPVGPACPSGSFRDDLGLGPILYVAEGGTGDGSLGSPLGAVDDALALAVPGATVAIGPGRFAVSLDIGDSITVAGRCASDTTLIPSAVDHVLRLAGADVGLRAIRVEGSVWLSAGQGDAALEGVVVEAGSEEGIQVGPGRSLRAVDVLLRPGLGRGLRVQGGARADLIDVVVEDCMGPALAAQADSELTLERVVARRVQAPPGEDGQGVRVLSGARLVANGLRVDDVVTAGVSVHDGGAAYLRGVHVSRGVRGVFAQSASVRLEDALIEDTSLYSVLLEAATATLTDVVVRDVEMPLETNGIYALNGTRLRVERLRVQRVREVGLRAAGTKNTPTEIRASDLVINDVGEVVVDGTTYAGEGLTLRGQASADVDRAYFSGLTFVLSARDDAQLRVESLSMFETGSEGHPSIDVAGVGAEGHPAVELRGVQGRDLMGSAVEVNSPTGQVHVEDLSVDGSTEGGLLLRGGASLSFARVYLHEIARGGLIVHADGTAVGTDLWVEGVGRNPNPDHSCAKDFIGGGVCVGQRSVLALSRFDVSGVLDAGLIVEVPIVGVTLSEGRFHDNPIGARWFGDPELFYESIGSTVQFEHNQQTLYFAE